MDFLGTLTIFSDILKNYQECLAMLEKSKIIFITDESHENFQAALVHLDFESTLHALGYELQKMPISVSCIDKLKEHKAIILTHNNQNSSILIDNDLLKYLEENE